MISPVTNWFDGGSLIRIGQKKPHSHFENVKEHVSRL